FSLYSYRDFFFFQAEDGIRDGHVTGVQTLLFRSRTWQDGRPMATTSSSWWIGARWGRCFDERSPRSCWAERVLVPRARHRRRVTRVTDRERRAGRARVAAVRRRASMAAVCDRLAAPRRLAAGARRARRPHHHERARQLRA